MPADGPPLTSGIERHFVVVWQDPETREFKPVGNLQITHDGARIRASKYVYRSEALLAKGFEPFLAFPDIDAEYRSEGGLLPFFANRVMSARRMDYAQYVDALGLDAEHADPVEILARSAGQRATDTVHVVPEPVIQDDGSEARLFLASGVRHQAGAEERVARLIPGDSLALRPETDNPHDPRAVLLDDRTGAPVGWVPSYLLDYLHKGLDQGADIGVRVERANGPRVPWHLRLLCVMHVVPQLRSAHGRA